MSAVTALPSLRERGLLYGLGASYLALVEKFCVQVVDVTERINLGLLLRFRLDVLSILATGTHQVSERCSFRVLLRIFFGFGLG